VVQQHCRSPRATATRPSSSRAHIREALRCRLKLLQKQ
jgi:hypothetical protein